MAAPVKWKHKEWIIFGGVGATTLIIMTNDMWIQQVFTTNKNSISDWSAKNIFEPAGNYQYLIGSTAALYTLGLITKEDRHKKTALLAAKSYIVAGVVGQLLKRIGSRRRPYQFKGDPNPYAWEGFKFDYHSFPSGHTNVAFALATVFAETYKDIPAVPIVVYSLATLSGLSRIHDNAHWASDVFAGAALGWAVGHFMVKHDDKHIKTVPYVDSQSAGLSLQYRF